MEEENGLNTIHSAAIANMKAILVICILLISFLFSTPSIVARELSDHSGSGTASKDPDKGTISCGRSGDPGIANA
ncbi:hypothetical protein I3843_Q027800 [Carya illinoinensis]|nr:hypothetical protein I3843_Q027800 [Carya illinoinensis]